MRRGVSAAELARWYDRFGLLNQQGEQAGT